MDVQKAILAHDSRQGEVNIHEPVLDQNELYSIANTGKNTKISWIGVKSFGTPLIDEKYIYKVGKHKLRLQPGYTAIREVTSTDEKKYSIVCKIVEGRDGPEYCCSTEDDLVKEQSVKPTLAVKGIFKKLSITSNRNWSGYEFFGLNKSDVLQVISCKMIDYKDPLTSNDSEDYPEDTSKHYRVDANKYPELEKVASIKARNAGKTSELLLANLENLGIKLCMVLLNLHPRMMLKVSFHPS